MIAEIQFKNAQKAAALRHGIAMRKHLIHGGSEGDLEVRRTTFFLDPCHGCPSGCVDLASAWSLCAWAAPLLRGACAAFRSLIAWLLLFAQTCTCWQNEESDSGDDTDDDW